MCRGCLLKYEDCHNAQWEICAQIQQLGGIKWYQKLLHLPWKCIKSKEAALGAWVIEMAQKSDRGNGFIIRTALEFAEKTLPIG